MKKLAYTVLLSLSALLIAFGLTALEAPPESVDRTEVTIPEEVEALGGEAPEVALEGEEEILITGAAEPALDPETSEPIDAQAIICNCKLGQPANFCPAGTSCQACPCLGAIGQSNGVCK